jgi:hypothetical protein
MGRGTLGAHPPRTDSLPAPSRQRSRGPAAPVAAGEPTHGMSRVRAALGPGRAAARAPRPDKGRGDRRAAIFIARDHAEPDASADTKGWHRPSGPRSFSAGVRPSDCRRVCGRLPQERGGRQRAAHESINRQICEPIHILATHACVLSTIPAIGPSSFAPSPKFPPLPPPRGSAERPPARSSFQVPSPACCRARLPSCTLGSSRALLAGGDRVD